jgi:hypothetical protein
MGGMYIVCVRNKKYIQSLTVKCLLKTQHGKFKCRLKDTSNIEVKCMVMWAVTPCNFGENSTFLRNISPPPSRSKRKPRKKRTESGVRVTISP